jgi:hypothetical protein
VIRYAPLTLAVLLGTEVAAQDPDSLRVADSVSIGDTLMATDTLPPFVPLPAEAVTHLNHLTESFSSTPAGAGLIPTGMAEAEIALEYARAAGRATGLADMVRNMAHVLHAIDPGQSGGGDGLGYGVRRAAQETLLHIDLAMAVEGVSDHLAFHAAYVTAAASNAIRLADEAIGLARQIERATSVGAASPMVAELMRLVRSMAYGNDADSDGRIGYAESEMGLAQAGYHLALVRRVERLGN